MDSSPDRLLPDGEVTLLFTDIEGSTRVLHEIGAQYAEVLADHNRVLRGIWSAHEGVVADTAGDAFFVAFRVASAAVHAAAAAQDALARHEWPHAGALNVRMGVHTGSPQIMDGQYWGVDVHYAARLCSAANGGQVLLSSSARGLVPDAPVDDLGEHALKDFPAPRRLFHLNLAGRTSADFPPPRTLETTRTNMPSVPTPLIGREAELEHVCSQLNSDVRLVTVTGVGGSGKTRLALACGAELLESFADGVFLVPLAGITGESAVSSAVASVVGARVDDGRDPEPAIIEHLARRKLLLIVDNMEHLLGAAPLLARLVEAAPGLRVIVTSQAPLRLRSEVVTSLESLPVPTAGEDDLARLESIPSAALLLERARAADPAFAVRPQDAAAVGEICRRLDGLPLALELAAARMRLGGPRPLLEALQRGLDVLGGGPQDLPERQRGLRAALDWTVSLLGDDERNLLSALGVFAEAWTIEQLDRMFGADLDVWEASAALLDFSLVRTRGDGRLTLAEPVREYAQSMLEKLGGEDECRLRHCVVLAEDAEVIHDTMILDLGAQIARATDLMHEFSVALEWSRASDRAMYRRLIGALGMPYYFCGRLTTIANDVLTLAGADKQCDETSARLQYGRAFVLVSRGDDAGGAGAARAAADCLRRLGDHHGEALALALQANILTLRGGSGAAQARKLAERAMRSPASTDDPRLEELLRVEVARCDLVTGHLDEAEATLSEIVSQPGRSDMVAELAWFDWAECALARADYAAAITRYAETLRRLHGMQLLNVMLVCSGIVAALAGLARDADAIELLSAIREIGKRGEIELPEEPASPRARFVTASRARLGEDAVARAERAGRARDLDETISWVLSLATETDATQATVAT
jgi:predicted ATPase/class 3 adenylate cyclase